MKGYSGLGKGLTGGIAGIADKKFSIYRVFIQHAYSRLPKDCGEGDFAGWRAGDGKALCDSSSEAHSAA